jgi:hypothetical protein
VTGGGEFVSVAEGLALIGQDRSPFAPIDRNQRLSE